MTSTIDRVPIHTSDKINRKIQADIARRVRYFAAHTNQIPKRLDELYEEWDIERAIEANASALAFTGVALGATADRRWLILPAIVTAFLFQHAVQGWCHLFLSFGGSAFVQRTKLNRSGTRLKPSEATLKARQMTQTSRFAL